MVPEAAVELRWPSQTIDASAFREAMANVAASVCLVTAGSGGHRLGRTITAAFSLSGTPPSILVSLDAKSALMEAIRQTERFSFCVLTKEQAEIADAFAGKVLPERRFDPEQWQDWPSGNPRLAQAAVAIDCQVLGYIAMGSHVLVAGGICEVDIEPHWSPLIWHRRDYTSVDRAQTDRRAPRNMLGGHRRP